MDIQMPEMDGITTTARLSEVYQHVRVIALTALDDETNTIRILKAGARAYLLISSTSRQLMQAIEEVITKGYQFSEIVSGKFVQSLNNDFKNPETALALQLTDREMRTKEERRRQEVLSQITPRELEFLHLVCHRDEPTYDSIADSMGISRRTVDYYRQELFTKFNIKSKVGLVLFAVEFKLLND